MQRQLPYLSDLFKGMRESYKIIVEGLTKASDAKAKVMVERFDEEVASKVPFDNRSIARLLNFSPKRDEPGSKENPFLILDFYFPKDHAEDNWIMTVVDDGIAPAYYVLTPDKTGMPETVKVPSGIHVLEFPEGDKKYDAQRIYFKQIPLTAVQKEFGIDAKFTPTDEMVAVSKTAKDQPLLTGTGYALIEGPKEENPGGTTLFILPDIHEDGVSGAIVKLDPEGKPKEAILIPKLKPPAPEKK